MTRAIIVLVISLWALAGYAASDTRASDELFSLLQPIHQLQGQFTQKLYGQDGQLQEQSSGHFRLLRPGYFAWDITSPDSQLIIADPRFIWHYDRDLETVTRRPVTADTQLSPLQILGGDEAALRVHFTVQSQTPGDYVLTPVDGDPGFKRLTLHVQGNTITGMDILDNLDQRVVIVFTDTDSDRPLTSADFAFEPPEGVDLFLYEQ